MRAEISFALKRSAAVFSGTVTAMEYVPLGYKVHAGRGRLEDGEVLVVRLAANAWWKGAESRQVTLHTSKHRFAGGRSSMEAHDFRYEVGKTYLVYAHEADGVLHANICTRTRPIEVASDDIAALKHLTPAQDEHKTSP